MNTIYIINSSGQVEAVNYNELVQKSVELTTSPRGVEPKLHIREEIWFKVEGNFFEKKSDAEDAVAQSHFESEDNHVPQIEEVTRFEGWTWGHQGNFPKRIQVFDTQEEADDWLFKCAEIDFQNDCNAPLTFNTQTEAEEWLKENTNA